MADIDKQPGGERRRFFRSGVELQAIREEIARLQGAYSLPPDEQARLDELRGISRRDFLRKASAVGTVVASGGTLAYMLGRGEPSSRVEYSKPSAPRPPEVPSSEVPSPKPESEPEPYQVELPEQLEGRAIIQNLVGEYNRWFRQAPSAELRRAGKAISMFIEIYDQVRQRAKIKEALPALTEDDFNSPSIVGKLVKIEDILTESGYYVHLLPTSVSGGDRHISYVAIVSGKIASQAPDAVERDGHLTNYEHIILDKERPTDSNDNYITAVTWLSAMTLQRDETSPFKVVQMRWAYEASAQARFDLLKKTGSTEKDVANKYVLAKYGDMPREQAIAEIAARIQASSRVHEEQHVADSFPSDTSQLDLGAETMMINHIMSETRGLLAALTEEDPKMGVLNIYMWQSASDPISASIGNTVASTLEVASGYTLRELLRLPDADINRIAQNTLKATNITFDALVTRSLGIDSPEVAAADAQFMKLLKQQRLAEQARRR